MKHTITHLFPVILLLFSPSIIFAQTVAVNNGAPYNSPSYLVENVLVGGCLDISNITYAGSPNAIGYFSNGDGIGISEGIVLSSGNINNIPADASAFASTPWLTAGDPQLDLLNPNPSNDAAVLQFDFKPLDSTVSFNYVFASEEYPEWVGSAFNDVFAFFITGPGVTANQNIAVLPGTSTPVGINFVNNGNVNAGPCVNCNYYIANAGTTNVFDAYTTILTASITGLTPCQTYHLKIAISDTQDWAFDSAVFLEANSFMAGEAIEISAEVPASTTGAADAYEGCQDGYFIFTRDSTGDLSNPLVLDLNISGTATSGNDYVPLPTTVTIPAGQSSVQIPVTAFGDLTVEGYESIIVQVNNLLCNCTVPPPATLNIYDSAEIFQGFSSDDITICPGDEVLIAVIASGSPFTPYTYQWDNGALFPATFVAPTTTTTYTVTVTDACGRSITEPVTVNVVNQPPDATITAPQSVCTSDAPLQLSAATNGGIWAGIGVDVNTGLFDPAVAIAAGINPVTITYTLNNSCGNDQDQVQIAINDPGNPIIDAPPPLCAEIGNIVFLSTDKPGGTWSGNGIVGGTNSTGEFDPILAQSLGSAPYTVTYTLTGNCGGTASANIDVVALPSADIVGNATLCGGASTASLTINLNGTPPFAIIYAIDNANQPTIQNINTNTYILTVTQAGTYSIFAVSDANGCTGSGNGTATITQSSLTVIANPTPITCNGSNNGTIDLDITATGSSSYTYTWSNPAIGNTDNASNLAAGTYTVTVSDNNACSGTATATIDEAIALSASAVATNTCEGGTNGSMLVDVQNGTLPYTYTWSNPALGNTNAPTGLGVGTYTVTISDQNNCTATATESIAALPINTPTIDAPANVCNGGTATLTVNPAFAEYQWSTAESTQSINVTTAGTYTVTVTTADACTTSATHTLTTSSISASLTANDSNCNGAATGSITSNISGGTPPYTYTWSNTTIGNTDNPTNLSVGTYNVTVTDNTGCSTTATTNINEPDLIDINANVQDATCNSTSNGSIDLSVSGGTPPYSFAWSNGLAPQEDHTNSLAAATYSVTVTDNSGCTALLDNITIAQPTPLDLSINAQDVACNGAESGSLFVTISGGNAPYSFAWSGALAPLQDHIGTVATGTYTVTVTDNNACTATDEATINEAASIELTATPQNLTCNGASDGSIFLTISGGTIPYSFAWSNGLAATQDQVQTLAAGNYSVTLTDGNGCAAVLDNIEIIEPSPIQAIAQAQNPICADTDNGSIFFTVEGGIAPYTFEWNNGLAPMQDQTLLAAATYSTTISDANNCQIVVETILTAPTAINIDGTTAPAACPTASNGSISMTVTGGMEPYNYTWSSDLGDIQNPSNILANTYTVTVTDGNGCAATHEFTVLAQDNLTIEGTTTAPSCNTSSDGEIDLNIIGGASPYNVEWSGGLTNSPNPNNASAGNYTVTVTDVNTCANTATFEIIAPPALSATYTVTNATCNGAANGSIDISTSGGKPPYTYDWSGILPDVEDPTAVAPDTYSVTITDSNACTLILDNIIITAPTALNVLINTTPASCGNADGEAIATVSGGTAPYTYAWTNASTTASSGQVAASTYTLTVTDSNACTATATASVSNQDGPSITLTNSQNTTCSQANGSISITINSTTPTYTIVWSNGSNAETLTNLAAATYSVTVTDDNACAAVQSITLTDAPPPNLVLADSQNATCGNSNGNIEMNLSEGTPPFTFTWSHNSTLNNAIADNLAAGTYTCTVTDNNTCTSTATATIINTAAPQISLLNQIDEICGNGMGSIEIEVSDGIGNLEYDWEGSSSNQAIADSLNAGTYTVTVTDEAGCSDTAEFIIDNATAPTLSIDQTTQPTCGLNNGTINVIASGGQPPYQYTLNGISQDNGTFSNLSAATHSITLTDSNNCTTTIDIVLNNIAGVSIANITTTDAFCGNDDGTISITVLGGTAPITYDWTNNVSNDTIANNLAAGNYSLTITDANACSASVNATIVQHDAPTASIDQVTNANCGQSNGSISIIANGEGVLTYTWSDDVAGNVPNADNLAANSYSVTVTDENNCTVVLPISLSNEGAPTIDTPVVSNSTCGQANGAITITASGGTGNLTYTWTNNVSDSNAATDLVAGTYFITVTDETNCQAVVSAIVENTAAPTLSLINTNDAACGATNGSATINVSGGTVPFDYTWTDNVSDGTTASNLAAGSYTVTVTDDNGCSDTLDINIGASGAATLSIISTTDASCGNNNGAATISAVGGEAPLQYAWTNNVSDNTTANDLPAGNYTVTVTDNNACSSSIDIVINAFGAPTLSIGTTTPTTCGNNSGSASVAVAGGTAPFDYTWTNSASNDSTASNLAAGNYSVTVTDANNCSDSISLSIEAPGSPTLSLVNTLAATCGNSNGSASVTVAGGTAPFDYTWTNSASNDSTASNLAAGDYSVTVTDVNNCSDNLLLTISETNSPSISITTNNPATCNESNGMLGISVSGGTAPFDYTWTNSASNDSTASNLAAGDYSVTVTDSNGCSQTLGMTLLNENAPTLTATATDTECGTNGGTATAVALGGAGGYEFEWNTIPIQTTATASNLAPGTYSVTVTDSNACIALAEATVGGNMSNPIVSCGTLTQSSVTFNWTVVTGATGYQIALNGTIIDTLAANELSYTAGDLGVLETVTISVTALSDVCGNSATISQDCTTNGCPELSLVLSATATNVCIDAGVVSLSATPTGGVWSGAGINDNLFDPQVAGVGTHSITYTYTDIATDCTYSDILVLTVSELPLAILTAPNSICVGETATLQLSGTTDPDANYVWLVSNQGNLSNSPTQTLSWATAGMQSVIVSVTNEQGCSAAAAAMISVSSATVSTVPSLEVLAGTPIVLTTSASSGLGGALSYEWQPPTDLSCNDCLSPTLTANGNNTYTVTVTDIYGCQATTEVSVSIFYQNAVIIPNAFSPNGDGVNDLFQIGGQNIAEANLRIRDRWGNEVYMDNIDQASLHRDGWDGKYKDGQDAELSVYVYYATIVFSDGTVEFLKGNVTLVR